MKKVLIVATVFKFLIFERNDIEILKKMGFEVHSATNMNEADWLKDDGMLDYLDIHKHQIDFDRTPFSRKSMIAYGQLKELINRNHFDLIHCHTPVAAAITRIAALRTRKMGTKIIYTSHGFHFHKKASLKNWILYYPIEYLLAPFTDMIITINREDYKLIQKFHVKEKRYIPGVGVDTEKISKMKVDKTKIRLKYGVPLEAFLILSIGELSDRKNHKVIIKAISQCGIKNIYYIICGTGEKAQELEELAKKLGILDRIIFTGQVSHEDAMKICHVCDIGALPSTIEGLGLAGIETLACGKPMVASDVHGIVDYVIDGITGITCNPNDVNAFSKAVECLYTDKLMYQKCVSNTLVVAKQFDLCVAEKSMKDNYRVVCGN
ncbi:glycosyltransferase [Lachnospiraceae bacterium 29-84]